MGGYGERYNYKQALMCSGEQMTDESLYSFCDWLRN